MVIDAEKQTTLRLNILTGQTKIAFLFLSRQKWLVKTGWYLAGGTALSLQAGHRKSIDLDFFIEDAESDPAPEILFNSSWKEVKNFFKKEVPSIAKRIIIKA